MIESSIGQEHQVASFRHDVMPILFRSGCNAGTCHGAARGKDGFMLSLFGYDARGDHYRIVEEMYGRRINFAKPEQSLLLTKATGAVPHTGGELFTKDSEYYRTLFRWIDAGAPDDTGDIAETVGLELSTDSIVFENKNDEKNVTVTALYDDGSRRDVTSLALFHSNNSSVAQIDKFGRVVSAGPGDTNVFARFSRFTIGAEVIVLPPAKNATASHLVPNNDIDKLVFDRLKMLRIEPSHVADDETFLRRLSLTLIGRPPTVTEYKNFMADASPDKRERKVDELLTDDGFTDLWTALWSEQLRIIGGNYAPVGTHVKAADAFHQWIRRQIRDERPLNEFVADMVAASGSNLREGPANLYTMLVHAPRLTPKNLAADFSQVFLGIQIQCAECHNHPFDRWTMDDYYSFVSFFQGVQRKPGIEAREMRIFYDTQAEPAKHLLDGRPMPARPLGEIESVAQGGDPRIALSKWLTAPENQMFAQNMANRIWAQVMGQGVINPVDDIRVSNPPVNAPLLDALTKKLVAYDFDLRSLVRDICNSKTFQLSSSPNDTNRLDTRQFSHFYLKRLRSDVLMDSVVTVTGVPRRLSGFPDGTKAIDFYPRVNGDTNRALFGDDFFETFGRSGRDTVSCSATKSEPTLSQVLHLTVGELINPRVDLRGRLNHIINTAESDQAVIEELFVQILSRQPTEREAAGFAELLQGESKKDEVYEDMVWSLLSSTEFSFIH
tara:strand:+ start:221445 stop:223616 length:2172 start_codon:yes stop_codon:yes gene_type:complete